MLNKLIQFVFKIITRIFSSIFSPLFAAINVLFPDLTQFFNYIGQFFAIAMQYFVTACRLALIPQNVLILLFTYFGTKFAIYVAVKGFKFTLFIYEKLKP